MIDGDLKVLVGIYRRKVRINCDEAHGHSLDCFTHIDDCRDLLIFKLAQRLLNYRTAFRDMSVKFQEGWDD